MSRFEPNIPCFVVVLEHLRVVQGGSKGGAFVIADLSNQRYAILAAKLCCDLSIVAPGAALRESGAK